MRLYTKWWPRRSIFQVFSCENESEPEQVVKIDMVVKMKMIQIKFRSSNRFLLKQPVRLLTLDFYT